MYLSQAVKDWSHLQKYLDFLNEMVLLHVRGPTKHKNTTLVRGLSIASEEMSAPNMINFVRKYNLDPSISRLLTWKWRQLEKVVQTVHQARTELHNATIRTKKLLIVSEEMSTPRKIKLEPSISRLLTWISLLFKRDTKHAQSFTTQQSAPKNS